MIKTIPFTRPFFIFPVVALGLTMGCPMGPGEGDGGVTNPDEDNEEEVITTVELTFTPQGGGTALTFSWADPEDDGSPVIDTIVLSDADDYDLTVRFLNELEEPAENITEEIEEEDDEHQVFIFGDAVEGPGTGTNADKLVTHAYDDTDGDGNPVGLSNTIVTDATGTGDFRLVLRHLPVEDGTALKVADLAATLASDGVTGLPGDSDADVTFPIEVE
jgi:hypothetical protein